MFPHEQYHLPGLGATRTPAPEPSPRHPDAPAISQQAVADAVLKDARNRVRSGAAVGVRCPCCDRLVKAYRRPLGADMARFLILLSRAYLAGPAGGWVDIRTIPVRGGDYAKLAHWGFVEQAPNDGDPEKRTSGRWRPTPSGLLFADGTTRAPSHVFLLDNREVGFESSTVGIHEALGKRFNYEELWGRSRSA